MNFEGLPEAARVWIHGFRKALDEAGRRLVRRSLEDFQKTWSSHGVPVQSAFHIYEDRFLIMAAWCPEGVSGCATDAYWRVLKTLKGAFGLDCLSGGLFFFRDESGQIQGVDRHRFGELVRQGKIHPSTSVFDLALTSLAELRSGRFEVPFGECRWADLFQFSSTSEVVR